MKKAFLNWSTILIKKGNPNLEGNKILAIQYGLEGLYLTISKFIVILFLSFILGIIKEFLIFCLFYNLIRMFAFGLHASKSYICLIVSIIIFVLIPYICKIIVLSLYLKTIIGLFCLIMIILYAPADTHKRPLIKKNKRIMFKCLSIFVCTIYIVLSLLLKNTFLINALLLSLLTEVILILPVTYKLFNLPYQNYKKYQEEKRIIRV
jgi:accessory gene regulator B